MLKFLAGRKRSRNAFLLFFVGVLTLSLIGLFSVVVGGGASGLFGGGTEAAVAEVADYKITVKDMRDRLTLRGQQMAYGRGQVTSIDPGETYALFGTQVLDELIREKIVLLEAERLNIQATDEDVRAWIRKNVNPTSPEAYRSMIQQNYRMTPIDFENKVVRPSITEEHLRSYITAPVQISPDEVKEQYRRANTNYDVRWVEINPDNLADRVQYAEADLLAYYNEHKSEFRTTTEQRRARYIFVDQKKAGQAADIPEEELRKAFEEDPNRYVEQIRVSQIVLSFNESNPEETVRKKAQDLIARARAGEDFAKLVRETSEDAATKARGGDLGFVNKNDNRDNNNPVINAFNLKQNEVSEPIKKEDKFYIFKVTEQKVPAFAEVMPKVKQGMQSTRAYDKAVEIIREAEARLKETKDPDAVAAEINAKYNAQIAEVRDTALFSKGEPLPVIESAPDFEAAVFGMQNTGEASTWMPVKDGFAVALYTEKRDANYEPAFEEVRTKVEDKYKKAKATEMAMDMARQVTQAKSADELKSRADVLIRQYGAGKAVGAVPIRVEERAGIKMGESLGPLVSDTDRDPVYKLNEGQVTAEPIKTESGDAVVVAAMKKRTEPDWGAPFEEQRKSIEQGLLSTKRSIYFDTYIAMVMQKMKQDGSIEVYNDVIAENFQKAPQDQAPTPGGLPMQPSQRPGRTPQGATPGAFPGRQ